MAAKKKPKPRVVRAMINLSEADHAKLKETARNSRRSLAAEGGVIVSGFLNDA